MAADGSKGPRPYKQRQARTVFVRVPSVDWPAVKRGLRPAFVGAMGRSSAVWDTPTPTPCVAYSIIRGTYDSRLMILMERRQEELGAIDPDELGFESMAHFRRYWMDRERNGRKFPPTRNVFVYRLRPWDKALEEEMGGLLLERLYGEWM